MKRILCFGDSNTFGYISGSEHRRYDENKRWTGVLQRLLGLQFKIIEEGLNSRTIISKDLRKGKEGRCGFDYLLPCLDSHDPLDYVIIMLGTNELKVAFNKSAEEIGRDFEEFIVKPILTRKYYNGNVPKVIVISPPKVNSKLANVGKEGKYDESSEEKSLLLDGIYKELSRKNDCIFLSALMLETGIDGVHFTEGAHQKLANMLYSKIMESLK